VQKEFVNVQYLDYVQSLKERKLFKPHDLFKNMGMLTRKIEGRVLDVSYGFDPGTMGSDYTRISVETNDGQESFVFRDHTHRPIDKGDLVKIRSPRMVIHNLSNYLLGESFALSYEVIE